MALGAAAYGRPVSEMYGQAVQTGINLGQLRQQQMAMDQAARQQQMIEQTQAAWEQAGGDIDKFVAGGGYKYLPPTVVAQFEQVREKRAAATREAATAQATAETDLSKRMALAGVAREEGASGPQLRGVLTGALGETGIGKLREERQKRDAEARRLEAFAGASAAEDPVAARRIMLAADIPAATANTYAPDAPRDDYEILEGADGKRYYVPKRPGVGGPVEVGVSAADRDKRFVPGGATGHLVDRLLEEDQSLTYAQALQLVQTGFRQGITLGPSGEAVSIVGYPEAKGAVRYGEKAGEQRAVQDYAKQIETNKAVGDAEGKRIGSIDKVGRTLQAALGRTGNVTEAIGTARKQSGFFTTGFSGALLSKVPGTKGYDLARTIETIKANIGFDKLQQIRAESPTGGALGPVSDFENRLLQATVASLEQSQSREQFQKNLTLVEQQYARSMEAMQLAYQEDLARFGPTAMPPPAAGSSGAAPVAPAGVQAQLPDGRVVTSDGKGGWN